MKLHFPAAARNAEPIIEVLGRFLPADGLVVEIGSGSGQHVARFARAFPHLTWQPSDPDPSSRASIAAYTREAALDNLRGPLDLDTRTAPWPIARADAVLTVNMVHIAPWAACTALLEGASRILPPEGVLLMYGPFQMQGRFTTESNRRFDATLRARNPEWGVRDLARIEAAGQDAFALEATIEMPANNFSVVFRRREVAQAGRAPHPWKEGAAEPHR